MIIHCYRDFSWSCFLSIIKSETVESTHCEEKGVAMDFPSQSSCLKVNTFRQIRLRRTAGGTTLHALPVNGCCVLLSTVSQRLGNPKNI